MVNAQKENAYVIQDIQAQIAPVQVSAQLLKLLAQTIVQDKVAATMAHACAITDSTALTAQALLQSIALAFKL